MWLVLGVVSLVVIAGVVFLLVKLLGGNPPKKHERAPIHVNANGQGDETTIAAALNRARPGDRIVVAEGTYRETLNFTNKKRLTIEPEDGAQGKVILTPRLVTEPIVRLSKSDSIHIKGLKFDGQGKVKHLVEVFSTNAGLSLHNLRFTSFTESAVHITSARGTRDHPIRLYGLVIDPENEKPVVWMQKFPGGRNPPNNHIRIEDCKSPKVDDDANGDDVKLP
jgi:hypothetical protein